MLKTLLRLRSINATKWNCQLLFTKDSGICCRTLGTIKSKNFAAAGNYGSANSQTATKKHANPFARDLPAQNEQSLYRQLNDEQPQAAAKAIIAIEDDDEPESGNRHTNPFAEAEELPSPASQSSQLQLEPAERERRLKVLQLEADISYQEGRRVPSLDFFRTQHWDYLLSLPSKSARIKYYAYLWQIEKKKEAKEQKKVDRAEGVQERIIAKRKEREENKHIIYGLSDTTMFLRIYDSTINHWQNNRLTRAMQFAPKIVLDCSYDAYMTQRESINASKQLMLCFADNRAHDDPFDLHYCNVNMQSVCMKSLHRFIPTMLNPDFPMNVHEKCFTEVFSKEQLVYLTPDCRTDLEAYNADDIYIVGAMVDKINNEPLSLAKAKRLNLRMARLPLDRYLQWGAGSGKSLTLDQMVKILLDLKHTGDWEAALQHVPRRKVIDLKHVAVRQRHYLNKRAQQLNVCIDKILENEDTSNNTGKNVRTRKEHMEFNLNTWASKKKGRNSQ